MRYSLIIGFICIAIAAFSFYLEMPESLTRDLFLGAIGGLGIGFLVGGFLGYFTKKTKKVVEIKEKIVEVEKESAQNNASNHNKGGNMGNDIA